MHVRRGLQGNYIQEKNQLLVGSFITLGKVRDTFIHNI